MFVCVFVRVFLRMCTYVSVNASLYISMRVFVCFFEHMWVGLSVFLHLFVCECENDCVCVGFVFSVPECVSMRL